MQVIDDFVADLSKHIEDVDRYVVGYAGKVGEFNSS